MNEILHQNIAGGKQVRGLTNRRKAEHEMCLKPIPVPKVEELA